MAIEGVSALVHREVHAGPSDQDYEMLNKAQIDEETGNITVKTEELQLADVPMTTGQNVAVKIEPSTPTVNVVIKSEPGSQPRAPGRHGMPTSGSQRRQHLSHIFASRRLLEKRIRPLAVSDHFKINGVSHDNRQDALEMLVAEGRSRGEPVILTHEPWIEDKPTRLGVAIRLLEGTSLGWVPAEISQASEFRDKHEHFAKLASLGRASGGAQWLGAYVDFNHSVQPLTAPAIPARLQDLCLNIEQYMSEDAWRRTSRKTRQEANNRCQISGVEGQPLTVVPVWMPNTMSKTMSLTGFILVAEALRKAQMNLLREGSARQAEAITIFAKINGWTESQVIDYLRYKLECVESAEGEDWSIELDYKFVRELGLGYDSINNRYESL